MNKTFTTVCLATSLMGAMRTDAQPFFMPTAKIRAFGEAEYCLKKRRGQCKDFILSKIVVTRPGDTLALRMATTEEAANASWSVGRSLAPGAREQTLDDAWLSFRDTVYYLVNADIAAVEGRVEMTAERYDRRKHGEIRWATPVSPKIPGN